MKITAQELNLIWSKNRAHAQEERRIQLNTQPPLPARMYVPAKTLTATPEQVRAAYQSLADNLFTDSEMKLALMRALKLE